MDGGDLVQHLKDEHKILQDKMDKIGAFRFTIKGWSVTIMVASVVAGSALKGIPSWLWLTALLIFLASFFFLEKQQSDLSLTFGRRCLVIEREASRLLKAELQKASKNDPAPTFVALHFVPGVAHLLAGTKTRSAKPRSRWQAYVDAHVYFYLLQAVIVSAFVFWHADTEKDNKSSFIFNIGSQASQPEIEPKGAAVVDAPRRGELSPPQENAGPNSLPGQKDKARNNKDGETSKEKK